MYDLNKGFLVFQTLYLAPILLFSIFLFPLLITTLFKPPASFTSYVELASTYLEALLIFTTFLFLVDVLAHVLRKYVGYVINMFCKIYYVFRLASAFVATSYYFLALHVLNNPLLLLAIIYLALLPHMLTHGFINSCLKKKVSACYEAIRCKIYIRVVPIPRIMKICRGKQPRSSTTGVDLQ